MKCTDCLYYWKEDPEQIIPSCHHYFADNHAPCEEEENEMKTEVL